MDSFVIIMGVFFTLVIFGPVLFLFWKSKNLEKKLKKIFNDTSIKYHLQITDNEVFNNKVIGIDKTHKVVLFISDLEESKGVQRVEILRYSYCKVIRVGQSIQLQINLPSVDNSNATSLVIYDETNDDPSQIGYYLIVANKWCGLIQNLIKSYSEEPMKAA